MRLVRIVLIVCILAAVFSWASTRHDAAVDLQLVSLDAKSPLDRYDAEFPITVGGKTRKALRIEFSVPGSAVTADLVMNTSRTVFEVIDPSGQSIQTKCVLATSGRGNECRARLHLGVSDQHVFVVAKEPIILTRVTADVWTVKRVARVGSLSVITVLLLLTLAAPLLWNRSQAVSQYILVILGGLWLAVASWKLALAILALLSLSFIVLRLMMGNENRSRWLAIGLLLSIGALVTVKAILPLASEFFANPGEFFFLPIGFSYFIIRIVDLLFKVQSRQLSQLSAREYFSYLLFPPTLAAGPVMSILEFRSGGLAFSTLTERSWGLLRIASGLGKKTLADLLMLKIIAPRTDGAFFGPDNADVPAVLFANVLFVYLDFSAYSDMAIGVARWWGWRVPENFDWPLLRRNMREFWRHWHMSLTQWVTRHVFMQASMEVRRAPKWIQATIPTFVTMLVIGLWHGFLFVWVLWALHHLAGIKLGDAVQRWAKLPKPAQTLAHMRMAVGASQFDAFLRTAGVLFVWWWVALSHAFTTTTKLTEAISNYATLLTGGVIDKF